jgi:hypothetical protein
VREEVVVVVLRSIRSTGLWSSTKVITVYRDPNHPIDAPVPRFLCVDGMHRVTAATRLITEDGDFYGWPPGWTDKHSKVRLECAVLQRVPSREKLTKYALMLNQHTGALVETSYLDVLETIRTARAAVLASAPADAHAAPKLTRGMKAKIVDMSNSGSKLTPGTIRKALSILIKLEGRGIMVMIDDIAGEHGHGWFGRTICESLLESGCDKFILRILESYLRKRAVRGAPELATAIARRNLSTEFVLSAPSLFHRMDAAYRSAHGVPIAQCCMVDLPFLTAVQGCTATVMADKAGAITHEIFKSIL